MDILARVYTYKEYWLATALTAVAIPLGHAFTLGEFDASIIWPAAGVSLGFLIGRFERRMLLHIGAGLVLGYAFSLFLIQGVELPRLVFQVLLSALSGMISALVGAYLIARNPESARLEICWRSLKAVLSGFLAFTLLNSVLGNTGLLLLGAVETEAFIESLFVWAAGDFFSLLVFAMPIALAIWMDPLPDRYGTTRELLLYVGFGFLTMLFFNQNIPFLTYDAHNFLYLPVVIFVARRFSYRAFIVNTTIFLTAMALFPPFTLEIGYFRYTFGVNLFLILIVTTFFAVRFISHAIEQRQRGLYEKKHRREQLVEAVERLFSLSMQMEVSDEEQREDQARNLFHIIYRFFSRIDYGACLIRTEDEVRFIDAVGYDIEYLNSIRFNIESWILNLDEPVHIENAEERLQESLKEEYSTYDERNPRIKESILMSVKLTEEISCEMSFDIAQNSTARIDAFMLDYFQSMQLFLNSFYETETAALEHDRMRSSLVQSALRTIDLYDDYTRRHSEDVAALAEPLARAAGYTPERARELYWAGIVHDIGKLGVDPDIVKKAGEFTLAEYEAMQAHPKLGADLLGDATILSRIAQSVLHHHERPDGEGYPEGLKGEEIPKEAAVLSVAEAVATMAREQSYARKLSKEEILHELETYSGTQFDADIAAHAITLIKQGLLDQFYR